MNWLQRFRARTGRSHRETHRGRRPATYRLRHEVLEDRTLPSIAVTGVTDWVEQGSGPITGGQVEGMIESGSPVGGAVTSVALHQSKPGTLIVGTANGGLWRTTSALASGLPAGFPLWEPLTDQFPTLAIGDVAFAPSDAKVV